MLSNIVRLYFYFVAFFKLLSSLLFSTHCSRHPEVKWAQRVNEVYITVLLPDAKNAKVKLEAEGVFIFSASAGVDDNLYELKLNLFDKVNVEVRKLSTNYS